MTKETDYLLGRAFALLTLCRQQMILSEDTSGISMIEDQYLEIEKGIQATYYSSIKDNKDVR